MAGSDAGHLDRSEVPVTADPFALSSGVGPFAVATGIDAGLIGHWSATKDTTGASPLEEITSNWGNIDTGAGTWESDTSGNGVRRITSTAAAEYALVIPGFMGTFSAFSVSMWHRQVQFRADSGVFGQWFSGEALPLLCRLTGTMEIQTYCIADGGSQVGGNTGLTLTASGWNHIVMTWDAVNGLRTFLDTVEGSSAPANGSGLTFIDSRPTTWGGEIGSTARGTDNSVDVLRLYDRALTPAEVTELYDAGRGEDFRTGLDKGLVHHWYPSRDPNKGSGTVLTDLVGSLNGDIQGGVTWEADTDPTYGGTHAVKGDGVSGSRINFANLNQYSQQSLSFWVKRNDDTDAHVISLETFSNRLRVLSGRNVAKPRVYVGGNSSGQEMVNNLPNGQWCHVVIVVDATNETVYFNGGQDYTLSLSNWSPETAMPDPCILSRRDDATPSAASMDAMRYYNRALTPAEVTQLFDAGRDETGLGPGGPINITPPVISGTPEVGQVATVTPGTWSPGS